MTDAIPAPTPAALADLEASAAPAARLMRLFGNEQRLMLMCQLETARIRAASRPIARLPARRAVTA